MNLTVKFNMDNAAFDDEGIATEASRILHEIAKKVEAGSEGTPIKDINRNNVGEWWIGD